MIAFFNKFLFCKGLKLVKAFTAPEPKSISLYQFKSEQFNFTLGEINFLSFFTFISVMYNRYNLFEKENSYSPFMFTSSRCKIIIKTIDTNALSLTCNFQTYFTIKLKLGQNVDMNSQLETKFIVFGNEFIKNLSESELNNNHILESITIIIYNK